MALRQGLDKKQAKIRSLLLETDLFDSHWYLSANSDVGHSPLEPLDHYITYGMEENRTPSPRFDPIAYTNKHRSVMGKLNSMEHFLTVGRLQGAAPIPVNEEIVKQIAYLEELKRKDRLEIELQTKIKDSGLFDESWYRSKYLDLIGIDDLFGHFLGYGLDEGRQPGPDFDPNWYAEEYLSYANEPQKGGKEIPFRHYIFEGVSKGFQAKPANEFEYWKSRYKSIGQADLDHLLAGPAWQNHKAGTVFVTVINSPEELVPSSAHVKKPDCVILNLKDPQPFLEYLSAGLAEGGRPTTYVFARPDVCFMPYADLLFPFYFNEEPTLLFSDFLMRDARGENKGCFLPAFSPRLFEGCPHLINMFVINSFSSLTESLAKSESFDRLFLILAYGALYKKVHIPHFCYTVEDRGTHFSGRNNRSFFKRDHATNRMPTISIIIPTKNQHKMVKDCIDSILSLTEYPEWFEVIVVDNQSDDFQTRQYLEGLAKPNVRVLNYDEKFNYSAINNFAVSQARGEAIVLLNNDTIIRRADWLALFGRSLLDTEVGVVGAKLLYPDNTVQHGGVVVGILGVAAHSHVRELANSAGFQGQNLVTREVLALTAACFAVRKSVYKRVGGLDTDLEVAFNDVAFCKTVHDAGFVNIWLNEGLVIHLESKTRGYDLTEQQKLKFAEERLLFNQLYWNKENSDPFYNENLSIERCHQLAYPPRAIHPWRMFSKLGCSKRVMMLSSTYSVGHGVAVVIVELTRHLLTRGYEVIFGGPPGHNEICVDGVTRVYLTDVASAARYAVSHKVDIVVAHTPPFFSVVRLLGKYPAVVLYDYGEPPAALFSDFAEREAINIEKKLDFAMAKYRAAISYVVAEENGERGVEILPLANSHLGQWGTDSSELRDAARKKYGWEDAFVVLNVCRFHKGERKYKGVDRYADLTVRLKMRIGNKVVAVLCGKGSSDDINLMEKKGLTLFPNVSDDEMKSLYLAADAFVTLPLWEGYNLPLAQALAFGLPVVASKIAAHDAFGVKTFHRDKNLLDELEVLYGNRYGVAREPQVADWRISADKFEAYLKSCLQSSRDSIRVISDACGGDD